MSIAQYSMRNRSVVWFILVLFIVGGVWAFLQMGKKEDSTFVLKSAVVRGAKRWHVIFSDKSKSNLADKI